MSDEISRKILFIDDETNVVSGIKRQFHKQFEIETALGGKEGLELIKSSGPFAVVVSDLRMDGMDGVTFLRHVYELTPDTVCVVLTGYADIDVAIEAVNDGRIFRFLTKPCPHDILL